MNEYKYQDGKKMRLGFTTGTAAALATQGALSILFGKPLEHLCLRTPKGITVEVRPEEMRRISESSAYCTVKKDGGDDKDVTDGMKIAAMVTLENNDGTSTAQGECHIRILGGEGIGVVTRPGLDQPVGGAAINSVPRQMIENVARDMAETYGYEGDIEVVISAPEGAEVAKRTMNGRLGIEGGISIIGTTGIVEPMSRQAFSDAMRLEIRQKAAEGHRQLILTPGNYGSDFLKQNDYEKYNVPSVMCSNFIGDSLDEAVANEFEEILIVGHVGKLIKLAGGIFNTHSRVADGRMEILAAHSALCGADSDLIQKLMDAPTTEAALDLLENRETVVESVLHSMDERLKAYVYEKNLVGVVLFSNNYGYLGETETARKIKEKWGVSMG